MAVAPLADVKNNLSAYLDRCEQEPVFVTRNGRIAAVIEALTGPEVEDYLLERSPKFRAMLDKARRQKGGMSLEDYRKSRGV